MLFKKKAWPIITVLTGATLEYYAYMLFAVMVSNPVFLDQFFPTDSASLKVLKGYLFFTVCALCRPLGALLFGWIGDRYGRRQALFGSLILMAASCFLIACVPTYAQAGVYAVILLFIARVSQIISASGETNGAPIFLIEHFGITRAGLASGLAYFGTMAGSSLATFACVWLGGASTWRYAFLIGGMVGVVGMVIRLRLKESSEFTHSQPSHSDDMFEQKMSSYLVVLLISACCSAGFYYSAMFLPSYWRGCMSVGTEYISAAYTYSTQLQYLQTTMVFLYAASLLFVGFLSDYISLFKVMKVGAISLGLSILAFLIYLPKELLNVTGDIGYISIALYGWVVISLSIFAGPSHSFMYRFFPPRSRYRSVSLCYSVATATLGSGTMPAAYALSRYFASASGSKESLTSSLSTAFWIIPIVLAGYFSVVGAEKIWKRRTSAAGSVKK